MIDTALINDLRNLLGKYQGGCACGHFDECHCDPFENDPVNQKLRSSLISIYRYFCEDNKIKWDQTTKSWIEPPYVFKTDGTQCTQEEVVEIERVGVEKFYSDKAERRNLVMGT